jgi:hypothetical protein
MFITKKAHEAALLALKQDFAERLIEIAQTLTEQYRLDLDEKITETRNAEAEAAAVIRAEIETGMQTIRDEYQQVFEKALEAHRQKRYDSEEPFVEIISENFSKENGVGLRLDWNSAFINYLKNNGFNGVSDEAIVDSWIVSLSRDRLGEGEFRG